MKSFEQIKPLPQFYHKSYYKAYGKLSPSERWRNNAIRWMYADENGQDWQDWAYKGHSGWEDQEAPW